MLFFPIRRLIILHHFLHRFKRDRPESNGHPLYPQAKGRRSKDRDQKSEDGGRAFGRWRWEGGGEADDEILTTLPHLKPSEVHSALAYYFDHQDEVDSDLAESSDADFWKSQVAQESNNKAPQV
jgi:hypothetical protein